MPINRNKKLIFIHIPKCAGTSIAKAFNMYQEEEIDLNNLYGIDKNNIVLQSLCLKFYDKYLEKSLINSCLIFTVVRNPYDRALSDFCWKPGLKRKCKTLYDYLLLVENTLENYNDYELMKFNEKLHYNHFLPQYKYIEHNEYKNIKIIKFENIQKEINEFIDPNIIIKKTNQSKHIEWKKYYIDKPKCINLINKIYKKDFEIFNYEMIIID